MLVVPAIDILDGKCVRLVKGNFDTTSEYYQDPRNAARRFADAGAERLHIVDLDGARTGQPHATAIIADICRATGLRIQTGGGLRTVETVAAVLDSGASRAVIGSLAVDDPPALERLIDRFDPHQLVVAADVRIKNGIAEVATHGWQKQGAALLNEQLEHLSEMAISQILVTDIDRDGLLSGPNFDFYRDLCSAFPGFDVQASGGVQGVDDIVKLSRTGASAVVIGKAFYEGRIKPEEIFDVG